MTQRAWPALTGFLLACIAAQPGKAGLITVDVPGTAHSWLADQPDGTMRGDNIVPGNAPVAVDLTALSGNLPLLFQTSGTTQGGNFDAEGDTSDPIFVGSAFNLSSMTGPRFALSGVFLDTDAARSSTPLSLAFAASGQRDFTELSPELQQTFFIGDGLTGEGTGTRQQFTIPDGADTLFLGIFDGNNANNTGSLQVTVSAVPEPSALTLLTLGSLVLLPFALPHRPTRRPGEAC